MFDELDRLHECAALAALLDHYAQAGAADREAWQDRRMQLDRVEARELIKLHGELLAQGWLEQNTGMTPVLKPGVAAACYRITAAGLRAAKAEGRRQKAESSSAA
jgi:hypothetical protein